MFDFAKNREVSDLGAVPEQFRPLYKAREGGGHVLDAENPVVTGAVEALVGLSTALGAARSDVDAIKGKIPDLSPLKEFGTDPSSILTGVNKKLEALQKQVKDGVNVQAELDRQRADMTAAHDKDKAALAARIEALQGQLYGQMVDRETLEAVGDTAENPRLLLPFVRNQVKTVEADGQIAVRVLNDKGEVRFSGTTGLAMTVAELVREMQGSKEYASLFRSEVRSGSGHRPGSGGGGQSSRGADNMTANQKIAAGLTSLRR